MSTKKKQKTPAKGPRDLGMKGFNYIAVQASSDDPEAAIYLYFKTHKHNSNSGEETGPTLFVTNAPPSFSTQLVSDIFSCFGEVQEVRFLDDNIPGLKSTARSAHVVYEEESALTRASEFDSTGIVQPAPLIDRPTDCGLHSWMRELAAQRPAVDKLQFKVDKFMEVFEENERQAALASKAGPQVDADGFTLVPITNKRKNHAMTKDEWEKQQAAAAEANPSGVKKKKAEVTVDFYRHQYRENKRERT
jgi:hypothetical protein